MSKTVLRSIRPLSKAMIEQLMELHEREILQIPPTPTAINRNCNSLQKRGLAGLQKYHVNNKSFYAHYITNLGIYYLSKI